MTTRQQLRDDARRARHALVDREERSRQIIERLFALPEFEAAAVVLFYVHVRTEVQTQPAMPAADAHGKKIVVPYCCGDRLELFHWQSPEDLAPATFGILEPRPELIADPSRRVSPSEIDLVLVPGLVFDLTGHRLGYGRGFYDRLLAELAARTTRVGLAFDCQVVPQLPPKPHDQQVNQIVTECRQIVIGTH
jgi:5-formyltetrahydrofolate cyclo-ligase